MKESFYNYLMVRCERFLQTVRENWHPQSVVLNAEYALSQDPVPFKERLKGSFKPIREGEEWGETWQSAWFHLTGVVPQTFKGKTICLQLRFGGEIMVFDAKGTPLCGLTSGTFFSGSYCKEIYHPAVPLKAGDKVDLWVEAAANSLTGVTRSKEHPFGHYVGKVQTMRIATFDEELWHLWLEYSVVFSLAKTIPFGDYRALQILEAMQKACDSFNWNPANAAEARKALRIILDRPAMASALTAWSVGHAHIDVGWLWPVRESIRKAARTFSSQLALMDRYPEYIFGASQAVLYQMVEEHYPALFKKIQKRVAGGRWEIQGGMWVEADCNVPSGESLVRQFLHGKNYFYDKFKFEVKNLWIPDVFGYAASLPQIIKKSGCDFFLTQKISWSQFNKFPYTTFRWRGVDGTEVLTHFPPENTYNARISPDQRVKGQNNFQEAATLDSFISLYGIGDGGGGPAEEFLERGRLLENLEGCPKHKCGRADEFFRHIAPKADQLPAWAGELYLEYHRGTLTTQAAVKRGNRKCEQLLTALEFLASMLPMEQYPQTELDRLWKMLLTNQFHDILPGSSIHEVYERTHKEHREILDTASKLCRKCAERLFRKSKDAVVLANTLSVSTKELCVLPEYWNGRSAVDGNGKEYPVQRENGQTLLLAEVPADSFLTLRPGTRKNKAADCNSAELVLENESVRYEFDAAGLLIRAYDKELKREFLTAPGNDFQLYHDVPLAHDAWDIDIYYRREGAGRPQCKTARKIAEGAVRSALEFTYEFGQSSMRQTVSLRHGSKRLDFITHVSWHESHLLLRTGFPVAVEADEASFDIQYARLKRSVHDNTGRDEAKFETSCQRYMDLSARHCGAAILNDCKYGCRVKESHMELTLLRSPKEPDPAADMGEHDFIYSFLPHVGACEEGAVAAESAALNRPPLLFTNLSAEGVKAPFAVESEGISLEVVKKAERDDSRIVRLVETQGKESQGILHLPRGASVSETNLIEWEHGKELNVKNGRVKLVLKPYEILTLRVR